MGPSFITNIGPSIDHSSEWRTAAAASSSSSMMSPAAAAAAARLSVVAVMVALSLSPTPVTRLNDLNSTSLPLPSQNGMERSRYSSLNWTRLELAPNINFISLKLFGDAHARAR